MTNYTVQIMDNMICVASNVFTNLQEATESAERIVNMINEENPNTSYAMIWNDEQLVNYI